MTAILALLGIFTLIPFLILYSSFSWGYVATVVSSWYILPLFPNMPVFTWFQYAGIMFFLSCFIHGSHKTVKEEYRDNTSEWVGIVLAPWLTLLGAWIFKLFY